MSKDYKQKSRDYRRDVAGMIHRLECMQSTQLSPSDHLNMAHIKAILTLAKGVGLVASILAEAREGK